MMVDADGALALDKAKMALLQARRIRQEGATIRAVRAMLAEHGHKLSVAGLHGVLQA